MMDSSSYGTYPTMQILRYVEHSEKVSRTYAARDHVTLNSYAGNKVHKTQFAP